MKIEYFASPEIKPLSEHSAALGWYSGRDWECFVRTGVVFGHRLKSGEIVSSAYLVNFENKVGWLGAVIVNSRFQGKKLGRDLIQKAISIAPDESDFVLAVVSTDRGKRMYEHAGFVEIGNSHKYVAQLSPSTSEFSNIRPVSVNDLDKISKFDSASIGYSRAKLLRERFQTSVAAYYSENENGELNGYIFANQDGVQVSLGPIVASNFDDAVTLVKRVAALGGAYRIEVPHWQGDFAKLLSDLGFELERICPLLTLNGKTLPRTSDSYFAYMAQALG